MRNLLLSAVVILGVMTACSKDDMGDKTYYTECLTQYQSSKGKWYTRDQVYFQTDGRVHFVTTHGTPVKLVAKRRCRTCEAGVSIKVDKVFYCTWDD